MTVISAKEFTSSQEKFFNLAISENVYIQNDNYMFLLSNANMIKEEHKKPDIDFYRAITMDEFKKRAVVMCEKLDKIYAKK